MTGRLHSPDSAAPASAGVVARFPPARPAGGKAGLRRFLPLVLLAIVGAVLGYLGGRFGAQVLPRIDGPRWLGLLTLVWLLPGWLLAVAWHELGHLVGGWLGGGRFLLWITGPFQVQRTPAGIRASWNRNVNLAGGLAACLPLEAGRLTPGRAATMILGGPVFSLVLVVAGLWLAAGLAGAGDGTGLRLLQQAVLVTTGLSALIALVTLAPSTAGGFKSDGLRAWELARGGPKSAQEAALLALTTAALAGTRPRDYDPALVARAVSLGDGSLFDLHGHLTAFPWAADRGDWVAAQRHLDHALAGEALLMPMLRDLLRCEYAWLLAAHGAPAEARAWLDSAGPVPFDPAARLRAEAAVLLAEGRPDEAAARARDGLHALEHRSMSPVKSRFTEETLQDLLRRATTVTPDPAAAPA